MYEVIYADPPWAYNARNPTDRLCGGVMRHYPVMSTEAIAQLGVAGICAPRTMLFLWATPPKLPEAMEVISRWGFLYVTIAFTWIKLNPTNGRPFFGVGYYTKSNSEICLLARRGRAIKPAVNNISQVVLSPRREHSRKPDEVRVAIERLYPAQRKLEMFARQRVDGWDCMGNEVDSDLEL